MKISFVASILLATIGSASADGHADICTTQFNWWYRIADNNGPPGYPVQTAKEKLMGMAKDAGFGDLSVCEMQQNANGYHAFLRAKLIKARGLPEDPAPYGFGFPFFKNKDFYSFTPTCETEINPKIVEDGYGNPVAACAFAYPGNNVKKNTNVDLQQPEGTEWTNFNSLCRFKFFGFDGQDQEFQWCMSDILNTMRIDTEGGYTNADGPDLKCPLSTLMGETGGYPFGPLNRDVAPFFDAGYDDKGLIVDHSKDPYQAVSLIFRQVADQMIDGMCDECETCMETAKTMYSNTVSNPRQFCADNKLCAKKQKKPKNKKSNKARGATAEITV